MGPWKLNPGLVLTLGGKVVGGGGSFLTGFSCA